MTKPKFRDSGQCNEILENFWSLEFASEDAKNTAKFQGESTIYYLGNWWVYAKGVWGPLVSPPGNVNRDNLGSRE